MGLDNVFERCFGYILSRQHPSGGFYGVGSSFLYSEITAYSVMLFLKLMGRAFRISGGVVDSSLSWLSGSEVRGVDGLYFDRFYPEVGRVDSRVFSYPNAVISSVLYDAGVGRGDSGLVSLASETAGALVNKLGFRRNGLVGFLYYIDKASGRASEYIYPYENITIPAMLLGRKGVVEYLGEERVEFLREAVYYCFRLFKEHGYIPYRVRIRDSRVSKYSYSHFTLYLVYNLVSEPLKELKQILGDSEAMQIHKTILERVRDNPEEGVRVYYVRGEKGVGPYQTPATAQAAYALLSNNMEREGMRYLDSMVKWMRPDGSHSWVYPDKGCGVCRLGLLLERLFRREAVVYPFYGKSPLWTSQFLADALSLVLSSGGVGGRHG